METDREKQEREGTLNRQPPQMTPMKPLTHDAYGGGIYGNEPAEQQESQSSKPPASETQSADGPLEKPDFHPKQQPPPPTGDRDLDITGQSYIQDPVSNWIWNPLDGTGHSKEYGRKSEGGVASRKLLGKIGKARKDTEQSRIQTRNQNITNMNPNVNNHRLAPTPELSSKTCFLPTYDFTTGFLFGLGFSTLALLGGGPLKTLHK